jgi:yecA family protein
LKTEAHDIDGPDLAELEALFPPDRDLSDGVSLSTLDGLLAAIAAGPAPLPPGEWLSILWHGSAPNPANEDRQLFRPIRARLDQIVRQLAEDPNAYTPIFRTADDGAIVTTEWARGFLTGVQLRPAAWAPLTETQEGMRFLVTILSQLPDWDGQVRAASGRADADIAAFRRKGQKLIPASVVEIGRFWKRRRGGSGQATGRFS